MGAPIARRLLEAGFSVRVWNRTRARAQVLAADGADVKGTPAEAADGAGVVLTMLSDGEAVEHAMLGPAGALGAMSREAVWLQMGTIGPRWTDRFVTLARRDGVELVDAPVSGSDGPARSGELVILASGSDGTHERVRPLLDALGRRTLWLGPAGAGSRLKLVINNWLVCLVEAAAETLALADGLDLDEQLFVDVIADGPLAAPYALTKSRAMIEGDYAPGFPLRHALKDVLLTLSAASAADVDMPLTATLAPRWQRLADSGRGDEDVAVVSAGLPRDEGG
jgi:3-hydroxyisobutyrate dehydrogenase